MHASYICLLQPRLGIKLEDTILCRLYAEIDIVDWNVFFQGIKDGCSYRDDSSPAAQEARLD